jgi:Methyltransferase domain
VAKYNVTCVTLEGSNIHRAFDEVRDSLGWALSALGHQVSTTENWFSEVGETNIIFGAELMADFQRIPRSSILYNLEQPSHPSMDKVRRLAKESGCGVWDYSARGVADWATAGITARHVPIGYTPTLTRIPVDATKDIDVCFFGHLTPRRAGIIDALRAIGLTVHAGMSCYGGARDNILSRSKVCLNVHHDGRDRFEIVRVSYLMANAKWVVTEESVDDDEYRQLRVLRYPYRSLVDVCETWSRCSASDLIKDGLGLAGQASIRRYDFTATVAAALDSAAAPPAILSKPPRAAMKRSFLSEARQIRAKDQRVAYRFSEATRTGDMKDFAAWMASNARGNIVEIGVRDGASTSAFLSGVEMYGGHLYSIDVQDCSHLFKGHPQWSFLRANSTNFAAVCRFIPYEIDVLLIDGDHSRAGVLNDIEYLRQLRPGGIALFHDIAPESRPSGCDDMSWPGDDVKSVYDQLCRELGEQGWMHEELPGRYGMGVLQKPPLGWPRRVLENSTVSATASATHAEAPAK